MLYLSALICLAILVNMIPFLILKLVFPCSHIMGDKNTDAQHPMQFLTSLPVYEDSLTQAIMIISILVRFK